MELNYKLPPAEDMLLRGRLGGEKILYCIPYDINERLSFVNGYFAVSESRIFILSDGELVDEYNISDFEDFTTQELYASGVLEAKREGCVQRLVFYSMEHATAFAYMVRILYELKEKQIPKIKPTEKEKRCPQCGMMYIRGTTVCPNCSDRFAMVKRLLKTAEPCWWLYLIAILLFWANSGIMLIQPLVNRRLIDNVLSRQNGDFPLFVKYIALMFLLGILLSLIGAMNTLVMSFASQRLSRDLKSLVFEKIESMSMGYLDRQRTGDLMNRINSDTGRIQGFMQNIAANGVNQFFLLIGVCTVLFIYNWRLALLVVLPTPFAVVFTYKLRRKIRRAYRVQWRKMDKLNSLLNDILRGIRIVKAFGQEEREVQRFKDSALSVRLVTTKNEKFFYTIFPMLRFFIGFGSYLVLLYGGMLVLRMELTLGELVQFSTYASYLYSQLEWFSFLPRRFSEAITSAQRVFEILDEVPEIIDSTNSVSKGIDGNVSFENVSFGYMSSKPVLKNISLDVKKGEMIGLVGHSGAGKSTFINLVMRLYDVDEGAIRIDGVDLRDYAIEDYKAQLGVVLQEPFLFSGSVIDNIRYAKPDATIDECIRAAKIANAHDFIMKSPNGYDTFVGENGYKLSGGERQRIAIARAVLNDPKILILDEATASVDTYTEQQIQEALGRLIKGRTTFAIAHRLSTLKNADRIVVLNEGEVAEMGSHDELIAKRGIYYRLVMAQLKMSAVKAV